ncbi:hypothetical protein ACFX10_021193 [Malus domestica]
MTTLYVCRLLKYETPNVFIAYFIDLQIFNAYHILIINSIKRARKILDSSFRPYENRRGKEVKTENPSKINGKIWSSGHLSDSTQQGQEGEEVARDNLPNLLRAFSKLWPRVYGQR